MSSIHWFKDVSKDDVDLAGGKGASLGEMTQAGFKIPPGFVIGAEAYEIFLQNHPRRQDIEAQLNKVNPEDVNSIEKASVTISDIIHDVALPEDLAEEITGAFQKLDAQYVAVRSSATAEDSEVASWAGELDTFLNTTKETLLNNVKKCWASLFSPRAIFYRMENKLQDATVHVAVVVQEMVESDVAGVCFTVHPVTEDPNQMIIEAGIGLGEAVVSGQITPDNYIIAKDTLTITDRYISTQTMQIVKGPDGGTVDVELKDKEGSSQKLSDELILEIAEQAVKIENHYGFPVDIEWAVKGGTLFITQARPITTLS